MLSLSIDLLSMGFFPSSLPPPTPNLFSKGTGNILSRLVQLLIKTEILGESQRMLPGIEGHERAAIDDDQRPPRHRFDGSVVDERTVQFAGQLVAGADAGPLDQNGPLQRRRLG